MPTGYTAKLYEGTEQSFQDFALECSRAFGALILMRDSSTDAPITVEAITDDSDYYVKGLARAQEELARLQALSDIEIAREARSAYLDRIEYEERSKADRLAKRARYEGMLDQVREWEPPSEDHAEFKKFMIEQLTGSIDFDTKDLGGEIVEPTPEEWLAERIARAERDIEYHTEEEAKRLERNEGRIRWMNQLRESLGLEALAPA
jgi:hypothetical protein